MVRGKTHPEYGPYSSAPCPTFKHNSLVLVVWRRIPFGDDAWVLVVVDDQNLEEPTEANTTATQARATHAGNIHFRLC
jgi:hypothetical protein